jgi:hypothetical protein
MMGRVNSIYQKTEWDRGLTNLGFEIQEVSFYLTKIKIKELGRWETQQYNIKLEKKYAPALDNYGQRCFVRRDL